MVARYRFKSIAGALVACLFAANAFAQHAGKGPKDDDDNGPNNSASRVGVDANGRLRGLTAEEVRELIAGMSRFVDQSDGGLNWTYLPSGAVAIDLDDRFQSVSLARVAPDGSVAMRCVGSEGEAMHFLTTSVAPAFHKHPMSRAATIGFDASRLVPARRQPASAIALEEK